MALDTVGLRAVFEGGTTFISQVNAATQAQDRLAASANRLTGPAQQASRAQDDVAKSAQNLQKSQSQANTEIDKGGVSFTKLVGSVAGGNIAFNLLNNAFSTAKAAVFGMNSQLETSQIQFEVLFGSADRAREHVAMLFEFAKKTPFETGPIIEASRQLQTFGGDALNTSEMLTLVGDAAAGTSRPFNEVAFWVGRMYAAIQGGQPFGEAAMRLTELAILTPKTRQAMEDLQKAGGGAADIFKLLEGDMARFTGGMEKQAGTWTGVTSTFQDTIQLIAADVMRPFFELMRDSLGMMNEVLGSNAFSSFVGSIKPSTILIVGMGVAIATLTKQFIGLGVSISQIKWREFLTGGASGTKVIAGLTIGLAALDVGLRAFTGVGIMERLFGDVARIEASEKALRGWNAQMLAAGPGASALEVAAGNVKNLAEATVGLEKPTQSIFSSWNGFLTGNDGRIFGFNVGMSETIDSFKDLEEVVKLNAATMLKEGASMDVLFEAYLSLPESLRPAFDAVTGITLAWGKAHAEATKQAEAFVVSIDTVATGNQMLAQEMELTQSTGSHLLDFYNATWAPVMAQVFEKVGEDSAESLAKLTDEFPEMQGSAEEVLSWLEEHVPEAADVFKDLQKTVEESFEGAKEAIQSLLPATDETFEMWRQRMASIVADHVNMKSNLTMIYGEITKAGVEMPNEIIAALAEQGPAYVAHFTKLFQEDPQGAIESLRMVAPVIMGETTDAMVDEIVGSEPGMTAAWHTAFGETFDQEMIEVQKAADEGGPRVATEFTYGLVEQMKQDQTVSAAHRKLIEDAIFAAELAAKGAAQIGRDMASGIIAGFNEMSLSAQQTAQSFVTAMLISGQEASRSKSPSKETEEKIGVPLGQGIVVGLNKTMPGAVNSMSDWTKKLMDAANFIAKQGGSVLDETVRLAIASINESIAAGLTESEYITDVGVGDLIDHLKDALGEAGLNEAGYDMVMELVDGLHAALMEGTASSNTALLQMVNVLLGTLNSAGQAMGATVAAAAAKAVATVNAAVAAVGGVAGGVTEPGKAPPGGGNPSKPGTTTTTGGPLIGHVYKGEELKQLTGGTGSLPAVVGYKWTNLSPQEGGGWRLDPATSSFAMPEGMYQFVTKNGVTMLMGLRNMPGDTPGTPPRWVVLNSWETDKGEVVPDAPFGWDERGRPITHAGGFQQVRPLPGAGTGQPGSAGGWVHVTSEKGTTVSSPTGMGETAGMDPNVKWVTWADGRRAFITVPPDMTIEEVLEIMGLPPLARGTHFVPRDMLAYLHRGEAVIPAALNPANTGDIGQLVRVLSASAYATGAPAALSSPSSPGLPSQICIDLSRSSFSGSPGENARAIGAVVREQVQQIFGRQAVLAGVQM